jgi:hypothetical protein
MKLRVPILLLASMINSSVSPALAAKRSPTRRVVAGSIVLTST